MEPKQVLRCKRSTAQFQGRFDLTGARRPNPNERTQRGLPSPTQTLWAPGYVEKPPCEWLCSPRAKDQRQKLFVAKLFSPQKHQPLPRTGRFGTRQKLRSCHQQTSLVEETVWQQRQAAVRALS